MPTGVWTHIVVTHDGSGERGGLHIYRDGAVVEEQGSEFFAKVEGASRPTSLSIWGKAWSPAQATCPNPLLLWWRYR